MKKVLLALAPIVGYLSLPGALADGSFLRAGASGITVNATAAITPLAVPPVLLVATSAGSPYKIPQGQHSGIVADLSGLQAPGTTGYIDLTVTPSTPTAVIGTRVCAYSKDDSYQQAYDRCVGSPDPTEDPDVLINSPHPARIKSHVVEVLDPAFARVIAVIYCNGRTDLSVSECEGAFDAQISATPPIPVNPVDQLYNPQAPRHLEDATSTADGPIPVVLSCEMAHAEACDGNGAGTRAVKIDCPFVGDLRRATNIMVTFSLISASNYDYPTHVHSVMYLFKSPTGYEDGEDPLAQVTISDVNSIQYNLRLQDVLPAVTVVCVISPGGPSYVNTLIFTEYSAIPDTTSHNLDGLSDDVPVDIPSNVHYGTSSNGVSINTDTYQPFSLDLTGTIDPAITTFAEITTSAGTATSQHGLKICCPTADPRSCWDAKHDDPIVIYSQPTAARSHEVTLQLLPNAVASVLVLINAIGLKAVGDFTIDAFLSVRTTLEIATVSPSPIPVPPAPTPLVLALAPPPNLPVPQPNATLQSADPISLSYLGGLDHPARLDTQGQYNPSAARTEYPLPPHLQNAGTIIAQFTAMVTNYNPYGDDSVAALTVSSDKDDFSAPLCSLTFVNLSTQSCIINISGLDPRPTSLWVRLDVTSSPTNRLWYLTADLNAGSGTA